MNTRNGKLSSRQHDTVARKVQPRESGDIEKILTLAEFEIEHDPYRGIVNTKVPSPWFECRYSESLCGNVSKVVKCSCPSLISWTRELEALKRRRKRKRADLLQLGRRRDDPSFETPCDYNPFCLASLGGVMDDLLEQAAVDNLQQEEDDASRKSDVSDVVEVSAEGKEVVNVEEEERSPTKRAKTLVVADDAVTSRNSSMDQDNSDEITQNGSRSGGSNGAEHPTTMNEIDLLSNSSEEEKVPHPRTERIRQSRSDTKTPSEAYLGEVAFSTDELDHTKEHCLYSKLTREQLVDTRQEIQVDRDSILSYVETAILAHANAPYSLAGYCDRVQALHEGMLFKNPLIPNKPASGKMRLALPPGMKNLGATCYLNTQLQCLARNTVFLDGIFAWKPSKSESRMDSVLSTLQQILARLAFGAEATNTTEAFSTALGLQNDEMQDPNEFARLLFQKMHEAFQQSSIGTDSGELSKLLPSLFEGNMTYETECLSCGSVTERSEKFMDINLPIVNADQISPESKKGQLTLDVAFTFSKKEGTSLQYCLESYMQSEELTEDNQYWCEGCQRKRDARRQVILKELPPVLNVQLCRYVYDRVKQTKKKLTDKVLLPQQLKVQSKDEPEPTLYRLCAVMKHLGNSAYRGHYIAEAMDWQTGMWFEFNDEKVKVLESGPSNSCDETVTTNSKSKGSQDAYNMYYVKESYLGQAAIGSVGREPSRADDAVVNQIASERQRRYDMLAEMCHNDGNVSERAKRRKRGLNQLLTHKFRLARQVKYGTDDQEDNVCDAVWVDGASLRSVFACSADPPEELLRGLTRQDTMMCKHRVGICPRRARGGKILPKGFYVGLLQLLHTERKVANDLGPESQCLKCPPQDAFTPADLYCDLCANEFKISVRAKLKQVRSLQALCSDLDLKREHASVDQEQDEFIYAVSKRFVTALRKSVKSLLKKLESFDTCCAGLDTVDELESFPNGGPHELDILVNSAIVCENGKCCPSNKRTVRYVNERVWGAIHLFFPAAITLKKLRSQESVWVSCDQCEGSNRERDLLEDWASFATSGLSLEMLEGRRKHEQILPASNIGSSEDFYIVHRNDIVKLRQAIKLVMRNPQKEVDLLKAEVRQAMFDQRLDDTMSGDQAQRIVATWSPVRLLCSTHRLVLNPTVFSRNRLDEGGSTCARWRFNDTVTLLPGGEYRHYVQVIHKLFDLLVPQSTATSPEDLQTDSIVDAIVASLCATCHPRASSSLEYPPVESESCDSASSLTCSIGSASVGIRLSPAMCANQQCNFDCIECLEIEQRTQNAANVNGTKDKGKISMPGTRTVIAVDDDVQIIEIAAQPSTRADQLSIRVLEVTNDANLDDVVTSLLKSNSQLGESSVRRSGRKRKQRFALGPVKGDEVLNVRQDHNMAAVRLHIFEKDQTFVLDQPLHLLIPTVVGESKHIGEALARKEEEIVVDVDQPAAGQGDESRVGSTVAIPFDFNEKSIYDVVKNAVEDKHLSSEQLGEFLAELVFIRRAPKTVLHNRKNSKGNTQDEDQTTVLMDSLLQVANLTDENDSKANNGKKKSSRRVERGFTGTFLHTASTQPVEEPDTLEKASNAGGDLEKVRSPEKPPQCVVIGCRKAEDGDAKRVRDVTEAPKDRTTSVQTIPTAVSTSPSIKNDRHGIVLDALVKAVTSDGIDDADQAETASKILAAVSWSIDQNPASAGIRDLTDAAYAKYLEAVTC